MPQHVHFSIPFSPLINPGVEQARAANLDWTRARRLVRSEEGLREFASWDLPQAVGRTYPYADAGDLTMLTNWFTFAFLFDDQFDGAPADRCDQVAAVAHEMANVPYRAPGSLPDLVCPITLAWAGLWPQIREGMSETWQARFAGDWARYMEAHAREVRIAAEGVTLTVAEYIALRRRTVGVLPCLDLTERSRNREVPAHVMAHPVMRELRDAAAETIAFMNDVHSLEREERHHDPHNLVLVLERELGCSRARALTEAIRITCERLDDVVRLQDRVPGLCDAYGLGPAERDAVEIAVEGVRNWIRGNYDWALNSGRYADPRPEDADRPAAVGFVDDLLVPAGPGAAGA